MLGDSIAEEVEEIGGDEACDAPVDCQSGSEDGVFADSGQERGEFVGVDVSEECGDGEPGAADGSCDEESFGALSLVEGEEDSSSFGEETTGEGESEVGGVDGDGVVICEVLMAADGVEVVEAGSHFECVVFGEWVFVLDVEYAWDFVGSALEEFEVFGERGEVVGMDVVCVCEEDAECGGDAWWRIGIVVSSCFDDDGDESGIGEEVDECAGDFLDEAEDEWEWESGCEVAVSERVGEDDEGWSSGGESVEVDGVCFVAAVVVCEDEIDCVEDLVAFGAFAGVGWHGFDESVSDGCVVFIAEEWSELEGAVEVGVDVADGARCCGEVSNEGDDAAVDLGAERIELESDFRGGDSSGGFVGVYACEDDGGGSGVSAGDVEESARVVCGGDCV